MSLATEAFTKNWQSLVGDHTKFGGLKFISDCTSLAQVYELWALASKKTYSESVEKAYFEGIEKIYFDIVKV